MSTDNGSALSLQDAQAMVGPGWAALVEEAWRSGHAAGGAISYLKEKYGVLSVSYSVRSVRGAGRKVARTIGDLERRSEHICEICGRPGRIQDIGNWLKSVCPAHAADLRAGKGFHALCSEVLEADELSVGIDRVLWLSRLAAGLGVLEMQLRRRDIPAGAAERWERAQQILADYIAAGGSLDTPLHGLRDEEDLDEIERRLTESLPAWLGEALAQMTDDEIALYAVWLQRPDSASIPPELRRRFEDLAPPAEGPGGVLGDYLDMIEVDYDAPILGSFPLNGSWEEVKRWILLWRLAAGLREVVDEAEAAPGPLSPSELGEEVRYATAEECFEDLFGLEDDEMADEARRRLEAIRAGQDELLDTDVFWTAAERLMLLRRLGITDPDRVRRIEEEVRQIRGEGFVRTRDDVDELRSSGFAAGRASRKRRARAALLRRLAAGLRQVLGRRLYLEQSALAIRRNRDRFAPKLTKAQRLEELRQMVAYEEEIGLYQMERDRMVLLRRLAAGLWALQDRRMIDLAEKEKRAYRAEKRRGYPRSDEREENPRPGDLPDSSESWSVRLDRVRRSQARTDTSGMTRPPRDPVEREFLEETGQPGPFVESPKTGPKPRDP